MHARKSQQHPIDKSRQRQRRLYLAAKRSGKRRFHALYDRLYRPDILWRAWREVRANQGVAGVDGRSIEDVESYGIERFLAELAEDLKAGKYRPQPVKRVYIPKPDGRRRPLGIPTVRDRIVQQACKIAIEPVFEASFLDNSYGFRPKRSAGQAIRELKGEMVRGWWVLDADIQSFFDEVDHEILERLVRRRVSDRRILKLIRQWLKVGYVESGKKHMSSKGTPQGGVISPLLANIYLHSMDRFWQDRYSGMGRLIRYCDDFVIVCRTRRQAELARGIIEGFLRRLKLTLHPGKTHCVRLDRAGFDFLGVYFHKMLSKRSGRLVPYAWPSQKAMKAVRARIRELTRRTRLHVDLSELVRSLNQLIRGWRGYFKVGDSTKKFAALDRYVSFRLWRFLSRRQGNRGRLFPEAFRFWLLKSGLVYFYPTGCRRVQPCTL